MLFIEIRRFFLSARLLTFSGIAILGIGIGASTVALALLMAIASLRAPGMANKGFAIIAEHTADGGLAPVSWRQFEHVRELPKLGSDVAAYSSPIQADLRTNGQVRQVKVAAISGGFFTNFTDSLSAGQAFSSLDDVTPGAHSVILSDSLATKYFALPSRALGQIVEIGGIPYSVVGVAPERFSGMFGEAVDAWVPAHSLVPLELQVPAGTGIDPNLWQGISAFYVVAASGKLSSGPLAKEFAGLLEKHGTAEGTLAASQGLTRDPAHELEVRKWLRLGFLLSFSFAILTSLNYSLLLLTRTSRFLEEVRLKKALGAGAGRLLRDLLAGPAAMVGASLIVAGALWFATIHLLSTLPGFYGDLMQGARHAGLSAFAFQAPFACGLIVLVALLPAVGMLRDNGSPSSGHSTATRSGNLAVQLPVIAQIALCGGIWIVAGMVIAAGLSAIHADLGYSPRGLTALQLTPATGSITFTSDGANSFPAYAGLREVLTKINAIPGVESAAFSSDQPLEQGRGTERIQPTDGNGSIPRSAYQVNISPDYFKALGTRLLQGRTVAWHNTTSSLNEIVLNETLARELWPGQSALNRSVTIIHPEFAGIASSSMPATVVGVAENARLSNPSEDAGPVYFASITAPGLTVTPSVLVRGPVQRHRLNAFVTEQVARFLPDLRLESSQDIESGVGELLRPSKVRCLLALAGALIMGAVAYLGLFAALTYYVSSRQRELALRLCFGATRRQVQLAVMRQAAKSSAIAALLSLPAWPLFAILASSDYLGPASWSTGRALALSGMSVLVALFAALLPARSAATISPAEILKEQ